MSNDVHIYRARAAGHNADNARRAVVRNQERMKDAIAEAKQDNYNDFTFGSLSPRSGSKHTLRGYEEVPDSPDHAQRDTNESDNNISSCSTLDIVNKVDQGAVQLLEKKINELQKHIECSELRCAELQRKLDECNAEKDVCVRRIEVLSAAHECRITEMHCVIAELTKKLRAKQDNTILEEHEPEECGNSEISYQEGSICNSDLPTTNPDVERQTNPSNDSYAMNALNEDYTADIIDTDDINSFHVKNTDNFKIYDRDNNVHKLQVEALQEEVLELKAQVAFLQSQILESTKTELKYSPKSVHDRIEIVGKQSQGSDKNVEHLLESVDESLNYLHKSQENEKIKLSEQCHALCTPKKVLPKLAERIKLNCVSKMLTENLPETEFLKNLENLGDSHTQTNNAIPPSVQHEISNLQFQLEQLKMQNMMLCMNLDECKENCDHLYLLCGKYESNAVAMQIALNCSDRAIEAYDVMLALLESRLDLMYDVSISADENRSAVENVARQLLDRLESEINICEDSLGPWQNTHFGISKKLSAPWTSDDEKRLRYHVSKLKGTRATVQNTIVNLQSPFSGFHEKSRISLAETEKDREKLDSSERVVNILMYEVIQLREDNLVLLKKLEEYERDGQQLDIEKKTGLLTESLNEMQRQQMQSAKCCRLAAEQQHVLDVYGDNNNAKPDLTPKSQGLSNAGLVTKEIEALLEHNNSKYEDRIQKLEQIITDLKLELTLQSARDQHVQRQKCAYMKDHAVSLQHGNVPETTL